MAKAAKQSSWIGKLPEKDTFDCKWEFDDCDNHVGKYYWTCKKHNVQDWFGYSRDNPNKEKIKCRGAEK
jgi:hypothetical protein